MLGECFVALLLVFRRIEGMRVTNLEVPRYLLVGESVTLRCHFNLDGQRLYSLKWWKDDRQFYQYIPKNTPKMVVFKVSGITVDILKSDVNNVHLLNIKKSSGGNYRCEIVGEAPTFTTHIKGENMTIIDPPDGPPVIRGQKSIYHSGEIIRLNCTSYRSRPVPTLLWEVIKPINNFLDLKTQAPSKLAVAHIPQPSTHLPSTSTEILSQNIPLSSPASSTQFSNLLSSSFLQSRFRRNSSNSQNFLSPSNYSWPGDSGDFGGKEVIKREAGLGQDDITWNKLAMVPSEYVIYYDRVSTLESLEPEVFSQTIGLHFPVSLINGKDKTAVFRCSAVMGKYKWATEVDVKLAKQPMADPQQLPTLHETQKTKNFSAQLWQHKSSELSIFILAILYLKFL